MAALAGGGLASPIGCSNLDPERGAGARTLTLADFSHGTAAVADARRYEGPLDEQQPTAAGEGQPVDAPASATSGQGAATSGAKPAEGPVVPQAGKPEPTNDAARRADGAQANPADNANAPANPERWIVDGLIGQVNGRPIFADEFLQPIEARLMELAAVSDRAQGRKAMLSLIHDRFEDWVNSELIISEAESQLTPEQQQGFLAWLRTIQEQETAKRGGTRAASEESMQEELGMSVSEFMQQRRDAALASLILSKRVTPRTIVSSRDIEREYQRREKEFNPPPIVRVGRIRIPTADAAKVQQATEMLAQGKPFGDVADAVGAPDRGAWVKFEQTSGASLSESIASNKDFSNDVKERLKGLDPGQAAAPVVQGSNTVWLGIVDVVSLPSRPLFDPDVQLQLKAELRGRRSAIERGRYLAKLRSRWISDDISLIEERLIQVAMARYWRA